MLDFVLSHRVMFLIFFSLTSITCKKVNNAASEKVEIKNESGLIDTAFILKLINDIRAKGCDCANISTKTIEKMPAVPPLKWSQTLTKAAQLHTDDMQKRKYFSHISPEGEDLSTRLSNINYQFKTAGENIAQGYKTEKEVVDGWFKSYGHCKNLMNATFTETGIAISNKDNFWTQVLASK